MLDSKPTCIGAARLSLSTYETELNDWKQIIESSLRTSDFNQYQMASCASPALILSTILEIWVAVIAQL